MSHYIQTKGLKFAAKVLFKIMADEKLDAIIRCDDVLISDPANPASIQRQACEIGIKNQKIVEIRQKIDSEAENLYDFSGLTVMPGIIDSQVHFRDPGLTHKEDFHHGTLGAIKGGVTAVFDMPNTKPNTSSLARFNEKMDICCSKAQCDFGLFVGATTDNSVNLAELEKLPGCVGVKIFMGSSTGDLLVAEDENLLKVLKAGSKRVAVHCEDEDILISRKHLAIEAAHPKAHPEWRNIDSALSATTRILKLAKEAGRPLHVLHITTEEELKLLADNTDVATVECLPQHLFFTSPDCYERLGSRAQMNPPIREARHQAALWRAIEDGLVKVIGSDHAPHTLEEKAKTYPQSPSGMPGVQTIVPIMLNFVNQERLTIERMAQLLSVNPAKIYQARGKGGIFVGQDADFTVVDLKQPKMIEDDMMATISGWTPYHGEHVVGWPRATIIRGQLVMQDDEVLMENAGKPVMFGN